MANELVKNYHRSHILPRCAMKVDLMKAFDSITWDFLLKTLEVTGFPERYISWIDGCITSPIFSVIVNGSLACYFPGGRV